MLNSNQLPAACLTIYALVNAANIMVMLAIAAQRANLCGCIRFLLFMSTFSIFDFTLTNKKLEPMVNKKMSKTLISKQKAYQIFYEIYNSDKCNQDLKLIQKSY